MLGWAVWITGLPGSGKSTIAEVLAKKLEAQRVSFQLLSIDMLRATLTPKPTYTKEERRTVYDTLVFVAELLTRNGVNVIMDATGNRRVYRHKARQRIKRFMEAYIKCPIEICIEREKSRKETRGAPRDIYDKGFRGRSKTVPGLGVPYEEPETPEVVVESNILSADQCADRILTTMKQLAIIPN